MNYEDDDALRAPVWDELNHSEEIEATPSPPPSTVADTTTTPNREHVADLTAGFNAAPNVEDELSRTFANISTSETAQNITNSPNDESPESPEKLISMLAPDSNPLMDLENDAKVTSTVESVDDPLFGGSSSLITPILGEGSLKHDSNVSPSKRTGKPRQLFNASTRLRRRKPDYGDKSGVATPVKDDSSTVTSPQLNSPSPNDPLGMAQKESEFVDETLDIETKGNDHSAPANTKSALLNQMDKPLYQISPRKSISTAPSASMHESSPSPDSETNPDGTETATDGSISAESTLATFHINVTDPIKVADLATSHMEYTVSTVSELLESQRAQVTRRYTDFRWLYRQLQSNHWGMVIPPPPEKQAVGRFKTDFVENRRSQMEAMLMSIAKNPVLQRDQDFLMFLTSDNFLNDSKLRAHMTASGSYNDNNDLSEVHISEIELLGSDDAVVVLRNGGIDGEQNKGFMSFSLSSQPKYTEPDAFFLQERERFTNLEGQLRQLYKSLEVIDTERNDLAATVFEFSKSIEMLAKLEVTKKTSDLLYAFAQVHDSIRESLERNSLQQSLTLGVTLDEYVRTLSSVRAIFNQRAKLGYFLVIVENDMNKKKTQFDRSYPNFKLSQQNNDPRCKAMLAECVTLDQRFHKIKERWIRIAEDIKREVKQFEIAEIKEFRNSMEISLEASIESQKECIELWETFYQSSL